MSLEADQRARIAHELIESLDGAGGDERARKVEAIRAALVEGEQSGIAEDSSLEGILIELRALAKLDYQMWKLPLTWSVPSM
ncbi:MAG: hypothetical protein ABI488_06205 [Polyangiaceae bacterium]